MDQELSTATGNGLQSTTGDPQTTGQETIGATKSSIQPTTASNLLISSNGVPLSQTPLSTVNLGSSTTSLPTNASPPAAKYHVNSVLVVIVIGLFILAVVLFWLTGRSVKNTTE
jgi:hypothetical protein